MSDISPLSNRPNPLSAVNGSKPAAAADQPRSRAAAAKSDSVELSPNAQLLAKMAALPDVRIDLVNQIKSEIEAGTYETEDKISAAIDNLADDLA